MLRYSARSLAKAAFQAFGLDLRKYPARDLELTLQMLCASHKIDVVVDVGANIGQFAMSMRAVGYSGRIVSFEPMKEAFDQLSRRTSADPTWEARCLALGDAATTTLINVSANSWSSSLLPIGMRHLQSAPESVTVGEEKVHVARFDSQFDAEDGRVLLKIDTQGYESQVLDGLGSMSKQVRVLSVEMSLVELYSGQMLFHELLTKIENLGFRLWWIEPEFVDRNTRQMLQVNGVFVRPE